MSVYATPGRTLSTKVRVKPALKGYQADFVDEYLVDLNPEAAGERVGLPPGRGTELINSKAIRAAIETALRYRRSRNALQQDFVLQRWVQIVRADPRELVEFWRVACRNCWGHDNRYQFTDLELAEATAKHRADQAKLPEKDRRPFDDQGGGGYTINKLPARGPDYVEFIRAMADQQGLPEPRVTANAERSCPTCYGHGREHVFYHDTRDFSPEAALLYLGVKTSRNGTEMLMRSKVEAEQMLARHIGLLKPEPRDPSDMTEDEIDAVLAAHGVTVDGDFSVVDGDSPGEADGLPESAEGEEEGTSAG